MIYANADEKRELQEEVGGLQSRDFGGGRSLEGWEENKIDNFNKLEYVKRVNFISLRFLWQLRDLSPLGETRNLVLLNKGIR